MAEIEKKPLNQKRDIKESKSQGKNKKTSKEAEEEEEREPDPGSCEKCGICCIALCKSYYKIIQKLCAAIKVCIAFFWYPLKERCCFCIDRCDKRLNPYKDHAYSNV